MAGGLWPPPVLLMRPGCCWTSPPQLPRSNPLLACFLPPQQAVYTALKETETRATDLLPYWKLPLVNLFVPRQRKAAAAVELIRCGAQGVGVGCCRAGCRLLGTAAIDAGSQNAALPLPACMSRLACYISCLQSQLALLHCASLRAQADHGGGAGSLFLRHVIAACTTGDPLFSLPPSAGRPRRS